jgi:hypothetical protein
MTNKRTLKKAIKQICETLFVECFAACSSANKSQLENIDALFFSIIKLQANYTSRISHPEPGIPAKQYFKDLREKFTAQASEIIDQINNLH